MSRDELQVHSFSDAETAIYDQHVSVDIAGSRRQQEADSIGQLFGLSWTSCRVSINDLLEYALIYKVGVSGGANRCVEELPLSQEPQYLYNTNLRPPGATVLTRIRPLSVTARFLVYPAIPALAAEYHTPPRRTAGYSVSV